MGTNVNMKLLVVFLLVGASLWKLYPTFRYHSNTKEERQKIEEKSPEAFKGAIKMGLDLQGGIRLVLQIDRSKLSDDQKKDAASRALEVIRNRIDQFGIAEPVIQKQGDDRLIVELPGFSDVDRAKKLVGSTAQLEFKLVREAEYVGPALDAMDRFMKHHAKELNPLGTSDSSTQVSVAATPGDTSVKQAQTSPAKTQKDTVQELFGTGKAEKDSTASDSGLSEEEKQAKEYEKEMSDKPFTALLIKAGSDLAVSKEHFAKAERMVREAMQAGVLPLGVEFAWGNELEGELGSEFRRLYLLKNKPELTGMYLKDAKPSTDQSGMNAGAAVVNMTLTSEGARRFSKITAANIDKRLAIVLDGRIFSAPVIRSKIPNGNAEISGMANYEEARDLSIVLRAGALPAPMEIIEERTVGPTLGQDSIDQSIKAMAIAMAFILLVMLGYYKISGFNAIFALILNVFFLAAILAGLGFTLTLPGIAGIILTVGMAVDANVLINERIREELAIGKTIRASIDQGYSRAFRAIFDSNITTIITGGILYYYGTGPIKGFAVTLVIGLVVSMFTAIWVTRTIFEYFTLKHNIQKLSI